MTRRVSSLKSVQDLGAGVQVLSRTPLYLPENNRIGQRIRTQRPGPSLVVKFPKDADLRNLIFGSGRTHPAMMHTGLAIEISRLYAHSGGVVLDPFGGMGTTAVAVLARGASAVLTEIEPEWAESSSATVHRFQMEQHLEVIEYRDVVPRSELRWRPSLQQSQSTQPARAVVHCMDAAQVDHDLVPGGVTAVITSPPYLDTFGHPEREKHLMGRKQASAYTQKHSSLNLARERNRHYFTLGLTEIYRAAASVLVPGGAFVIVTKDVVRKGIRQPFALQNIHILEGLGLELRDWWRRRCIPSAFANVQRKQRPDACRVDLEDVLVFEKVGNNFTGSMNNIAVLGTSAVAT